MMLLDLFANEISVMFVDVYTSARSDSYAADYKRKLQKGRTGLFKFGWYLSVFMLVLFDQFIVVSLYSTLAIFCPGWSRAGFQYTILTKRLLLVNLGPWSRSNSSFSLIASSFRGALATSMMSICPEIKITFWALRRLTSYLRKLAVMIYKKGFVKIFITLLAVARA